MYNAMLAKDQLRITPIGDSSFCCFAESDAYEAVLSLLRADPLCLTDGRFDGSVRNTDYSVTGRVVSVR